MTLKIEVERCRAATTSSRSERISTMSAASIATDVPDDKAIPAVAATSAGESLMPSPTYRSHRTLQLGFVRGEEVKRKRTIATPTPFSIISIILLALPLGDIPAYTHSSRIPT